MWELLVFGALFVLAMTSIGFMMHSHHTTIRRSIDDENDARGELAKIKLKAEIDEANFIMGINDAQAKTDAIMMRRRRMKEAEDNSPLIDEAVNVSFPWR